VLRDVGILGDTNGTLLEKLVKTKMIADAWDLGRYQVGRFPGFRWSERNDCSHDTVRRRGQARCIGRNAAP
jgi:glycogen operon protein